MSFLDQLRTQREALISEAEQIAESLDGISKSDNEGNPVSSLSKDTIDTMIERSANINNELDRMDADIKELERHAAIRTRDKGLSPFAGIQPQAERKVSDLNRMDLGGGQYLNGTIPGRTIGEAIVAKARELGASQWRNDNEAAERGMAQLQHMSFPVFLDPNSRVFLDANDINATELPQAAEQMYGIGAAMATGYFIDLLPVVNGTGRIIQWNETPTKTSTTVRRSFSSGNPQAGNERDYTTVSRTMGPTEFSVFSDIARSTLMERSDAAAWINGQLNINYKEWVSPEACRTGSVLTGIIGVGHANLRSGGNMITKSFAHGGTDNSVDGIAAMNAILSARDDLAGQSPGRKVVAVERAYFTRMQEARASNDSYKMYPGLDLPQPMYGGMNFVPVDVGFDSAVSSGTLKAVVMDFATNSEHVVADREVFIDPYSQRSFGNHRYILDGKSGYLWRNRFGIGLVSVS